MNKYDKTTLRSVFDRNNRRCHLCGKQVAYSNYNAPGKRGAWEVDHSVPVAKGDTDHLNNLRPAHIRCNRSKQARSSRNVRKGNGLHREPLSMAAFEKRKIRNAAAGAFAAGLLGLRFAGPPGLLIGALAGGVSGYSMDPEIL